jgi:hypothetical protein
MIGGLLAPWEGLDVYAYVRLKQAKANFFTSGTTLFGYKIRGIEGGSTGPRCTGVVLTKVLPVAVTQRMASE